MEFDQPDATDRPTNQKTENKERSAQNVSNLKWYIYNIFTFTGFIIILWLIKMVNVCLESWADDNENSNNLLKSKVK